MKGQSLIEAVCSQDNLHKAWRKVRANVAMRQRARSSGVDEVSVAAFEQQWEANLTELQRSLRDGSYRPLPPRRVELSKPGGGKRVIGVLAVRDRIAQRATQQVLEPIFEAHFLDCSYGFRPQRSVEDAIHRIMCYHQAGCEWVFDADIAACFDSLDHRRLLRFVETSVPDPVILDLIQSWLEVGLLEVDEAVRQRSGSIEHLVSKLGQWLNSPANPLALSGQQGSYMAEDEWPVDGWHTPAQPSLLQRAGTELFVLGLAGVKPIAARLRPLVRWLARRKRTVLGVTGTVGMLGLAGLWWGLQQWEPRGQGALQGGALSPLLANVYLHHFDQPLTEKGYRLVRFADDFVICCETRAAAETAAGDAARILSDLQLRLNIDKTRVASFEHGFRFLGRQFRQNKVTPPLRKR
ncbi:MAG: reverse transcriptase domain-containing protein [Anaerolineae bacterium]